jgi:hypothetical protein
MPLTLLFYVNSRAPFLLALSVEAYELTGGPCSLPAPPQVGEFPAPQSSVILPGVWCLCLVSRNGACGALHAELES